ncbi:tetratricopeptide repeat protein [Thalassomonas sp. M1454]|uniref:tetratricopeptide repeat protein n=1 Tax=Thalassomonas sp. M1454 TaxID=2594477 RepID=UPI00117D1D84|nr:tetratricopeptide repeat protein [Thalassomonas sp. M1454]TRX54939.1 hypothetical protein FNN08_10060 [Thalassomonas sp. M1454]
MVTYQQTLKANENVANNPFKSVLAFLSAKKKHLVIAIIAVLALSIYLKPQSFINLWLTRDQQGQIYFERGDYEKAALTFADTKWVAYSYYLQGDFKQAAAIYSRFDDLNSNFAKANADAHSGKYLLAIDEFEQVLKQQPDHKGAAFNKDMLEKLMATMVKKPGKKAVDDEGEISFRKQEMDAKDIKDKAEKKSLSDEMWLENVQKNPEKFLRKKFQLEYINASK